MLRLTSVFIVIVSHSQAKWNSAQEVDQSETAVFIEPPEGAVTRVRLPLMCCTASFVTVISAVMKTYELNVSCTLADSERWPGFDADAPSGLLLPSAHPSAARPLSAHCARPAAAVYGRISLKTSSLYTQSERRGTKMVTESWPKPSICFILLHVITYIYTQTLHFKGRNLLAKVCGFIKEAGVIGFNCVAIVRVWWCMLCFPGREDIKGRGLIISRFIVKVFQQMVFFTCL